jgi:alpha-N-acetylglucosamine transferase
LEYHIQDFYYRGCYEKFYVFLLTEYERVVLLDADGIATNNLDHLFWLKLPENVELASPQGYWFQNSGLIPANQECKIAGGPYSYNNTM